MALTLSTSFLFLFLFTLILADGVFATSCRACDSSIEGVFNGSKVHRFFKVEVDKIVKKPTRAIWVRGRVEKVYLGSCRERAAITVRVARGLNNSCAGLPEILPGGIYGMPLLPMKMQIFGVMAYNLRGCIKYSEWSAYSQSDIQFLERKKCFDEHSAKPSPSGNPHKSTSLTPRPTPKLFQVKMQPSRNRYPSPQPVPSVPVSPPEARSGPTPPVISDDCPVMETPGLLSKDNSDCGPVPTRKDIVVKPEDDVKSIVEGAQPGSFIFFTPGKYSFDSVQPRSGCTLWATPGTVRVEGDNRPSCIINMDSEVDVRIYGLSFYDFKPIGERGVINAPTNSIRDRFNAKADPVYGFNPPNGWIVDCCEFFNWKSDSTGKTAAVECGTGMTIRGNKFQGGEGFAVNCFAKDVAIFGNTFKSIQMRMKHDEMHCAAIKLVSHKDSQIVNNLFEDIGCKAIWMDINCERMYVSHNHGSNIGTSFIHLEIGGSGSVFEYNYVEGFASREQTGAGDWVKSAAIWLSTSGGSDLKPEEQGTVVRGNYIRQIVTNDNSRFRSGILDLDQYIQRNIDKVDAASWNNEIGHIPDQRGDTRPGLDGWSSAYNKFYGNVCVGCYRNGIRGSSPAYARPDLTGRWWCNSLEGEFKISVECSDLGTESLKKGTSQFINFDESHFIWR